MRQRETNARHAILDTTYAEPRYTQSAKVSHGAVDIRLI